MSTSKYTNLPESKRRIFISGLVYRPDKEKDVICFVDAEFSGGWGQADTNNASNVISCLGYVITYMGCPLLLCSKLHTEIDLITAEA